MSRPIRSVSATGRSLALGLGLLAAFASAPAAADSVDELFCYPLPHNYGPFDYRSATREQKITVEGAHFFASVENLRRGVPHPTKGYIMIPGAELDYTLRAFPNHPRALMALSRLAIRDKTDRPAGVKSPVPCYFKEAITFRPKDPMVRVIYGIHLAKTGKNKEAIEQFDQAKELGEDNANLYYNLGLAYFEIKNYPEALAAAHKAYALRFPLPGLKNKLVQAGAWKEPLPAEEIPETPKVTAENASAASEAGEPAAPAGR